MGLFAPAVKHESKLRLAITGPSGSGKTYTALAVATGMTGGQGIALVDTEHGSASKYADLFRFDVLEMHPPYHPDRFVEAINEAAKAGYKVIVLDSLTHAWQGEGGMLDIVDKIARDNARKNGGAPNTFAAWKDGTPIQARLIEGITGAQIHVIATMRSKQDSVQEKDERTGKTVIRKVGMSAQQRDGFEYEFDVVIDMDIDHVGTVTKSRAVTLADREFRKPGGDVAALLLDWLQGAPAAERKPEPPAQPAPNGNAERVPASDKTLKRLHAVGIKAYGGEWDEKRHALVVAASKGAAESSKDLTEAEAATLIAGMEKKIAAAKPAPAVPDDVNFGMGDQPFDDDAPVPTIHVEQPVLVPGGGKGTY